MKLKTRFVNIVALSAILGVVTTSSFAMLGGDEKDYYEDELRRVMNYHASRGVPSYKNLSSEEQGLVLGHAQKLCSSSKYKPDTGALKQAIKDVVYDGPAHHVLGWYKGLPDPGVQFYKTINKKHSQQIIETAKELSYNQGKKPDSSTITRAYDHVMIDELQYVFDYHRHTTKAPIYITLSAEDRHRLIHEALRLLKVNFKECPQPDTRPLTMAFKHLALESVNDETVRNHGATYKFILEEAKNILESIYKDIILPCGYSIAKFDEYISAMENMYENGYITAFQLNQQKAIQPDYMAWKESARDRMSLEGQQIAAWISEQLKLSNAYLPATPKQVIAILDENGMI